jgi:hypothetical protein
VNLSAFRLADPEHGEIDDVVDLDRYPITQPESPAWMELVTSARAQLADDGCLTLAGFLLPEALDQAASELAALAPKANIHTERTSVYARADAERELPAGDPRRIKLDHTFGHLTRDQIPPDTVVARIYAAPPFKRFIAACVGEPRVFEYADPLAGLIATVLPPGGAICWHYDTNEFVVTIMTQRPERGGQFLFCPGLRRTGDENLEALGRVLRGQSPELIKTRDLRPGDLQIFLGRYSLHQVAEVQGSRQRHVAVHSYANRPGVIGPVDRTRAVYGRVTEAHLVAEELAAMTAAAAGPAPDGLIL